MGFTCSLQILFSFENGKPVTEMYMKGKLLYDQGFILNEQLQTHRRGVETVGPVSPVRHGHLRSDSSFVRPNVLKCYLGDIQLKMVLQ